MSVGIVVCALAFAAGAPLPPVVAPSADAQAKLPTVTTIDGPGAADDARKTAEAYLRALEGKGDGTAKNYLLGGLTLTAQDFTIPNWKIVKRDAARVEEKPIEDAMKAMWMLDKAGAEALNAIVVTEGESLQLDQAQAAQLLGPTKQLSQKFQGDFPLFSYVARVGRDVFWHPDNPWRKEAKKLGRTGNYRLELHRFTVEEKEPGRAPRLWPLRVLRVTSKTYDSGWKILPASDWDPTY